MLCPESGLFVVKLVSGEPLASPLETINFISDSKTILQHKFSARSVTDCKNPKGKVVLTEACYIFGLSVLCILSGINVIYRSWSPPSGSGCCRFFTRACDIWVGYWSWSVEGGDLTVTVVSMIFVFPQSDVCLWFSYDQRRSLQFVISKFPFAQWNGCDSYMAIHTV